MHVDCLTEYIVIMAADCVICVLVPVVTLMFQL